MQSKKHYMWFLNFIKIPSKFYQIPYFSFKILLMLKVLYKATEMVFLILLALGCTCLLLGEHLVNNE